MSTSSAAAACALALVAGMATKGYDELVDTDVGMAIPMELRARARRMLQLVIVGMYAALVFVSPLMNVLLGFMAVWMFVADWMLGKIGPELSTNLDDSFFRLFNVVVVAVFAVSCAVFGLWRRVLHVDVALGMCAIVTVGLLDFLAFNEELSPKKVWSRAITSVAMLGVLMVPRLRGLAPLVYMTLGYLLVWFVSKALEACAPRRPPLDAMEEHRIVLAQVPR